MTLSLCFPQPLEFLDETQNREIFGAEKGTCPDLTWLKWQINHHFAHTPPQGYNLGPDESFPTNEEGHFDFCGDLEGVLQVSRSSMKMNGNNNKFLTNCTRLLGCSIACSQDAAGSQDQK